MNSSVLSNLIIKKVRHVASIFTNEGASARREDRECWSLVIKYEGQTVYNVNGKNIISDINHIIILPKGSSYAWKCVKKGYFSCVEFDSDLTYPEPLSVPVQNAEAILKRFNELESKYNQKGIARELENVRDVYSILISILSAETKSYSSSEKRRKIAPALEYISLHYKEKITNDNLAEVSKISNVYFRKIFTEIMGMSPITYINNFKISKAKEMLKSDYGSLTDLALSLGYPNLYTFSRDFKKYVGVSPTKFAKENTSIRA